MSWLIPVQVTLDIKICEGKSPSQKCRYLATDDNNRPACLKLNKELRTIIDEEIELFMKDKRGKVIRIGDVYHIDAPIGDNCPGVAMES